MAAALDAVRTENNGRTLSHLVGSFEGHQTVVVVCFFAHVIIPLIYNNFCFLKIQIKVYHNMTDFTRFIFNKFHLMVPLLTFTFFRCRMK